MRKLKFGALVLVVCFALAACGAQRNDYLTSGLPLLELEGGLGIPEISDMEQDVIRIWRTELFAGSLLSVCYIFPNRGTVRYYEIINDQNGMNAEGSDDEEKNLVDLLIATEFHLCRDITFDDSVTSDGIEYVVESIIDGEYVKHLYNNPGVVASKEAQLVARAMELIRSRYDP